MKKFTVLVPAEVTEDQVRDALEFGQDRQTLHKLRDTNRLKRVQDGVYAMRIPIGFEKKSDGTIKIDDTTAPFVIAMFAILAESRLRPHETYGKVSLQDVHKAYLRSIGETNRKHDPAYVRAVINRRTYIGEIHYRKKLRGTCPSIMPTVLFELCHETFRIKQKPIQRNPTFRRAKNDFVYEQYVSFLRNAGVALNIWRTTENQEVSYMSALGFDLHELASTLYTFSAEKLTRRKLQCLQQHRNLS